MLMSVQDDAEINLNPISPTPSQDALHDTKYHYPSYAFRHRNDNQHKWKLLIARHDKNAIKFIFLYKIKTPLIVITP